MELIKNNGNIRETYGFYQAGSTFFLDKYLLEEKPAGKRKYQTIKYWDRLFNRYSTIVEEDIPWDDTIINEVYELACKQIKIKKWENN